MRIRMILGEAFRSLTANLSTTLAATMTVLVGMFLLGLFIALGSWVVSWSESAKKELLVKVFYETDATNAQMNAVRARLVADKKRVKEVRFVSRAVALKEMQKKFPELTENLTSNPLPPSHEVIPTRGEYVDDIAASLTPKPPAVEKVNYGEKTAKGILRVARVIQVIFLVAIVVLVVASTLLIANTIRLSIFARRREIEVMKLVGATNWFVRGPFMLEGLVCGLVGSLAAVALLLLGKELALPAILGHLDTARDDVEAVAFTVNALILLAVGLLLGAAGSGITLRRFLRV